jgi:hypothetical protein
MKKLKIELEKRALNEDDLSQLVDVYFGCFNKKVGVDYFKWKYFENPAGHIIGTVACDNGKVVALYGLIPDEYLVNNSKVIVYQAMDIMVHPDYQGMGLFTKLSIYTSIKIFQDFGDSYFVGYPGQTSYPAFTQKAGWQNPTNIRLQFTHKALFKTRTLFSKKVKFNAFAFDKMDERFDDFFAKKVLNDMPIQIKITPTFINWRCFSLYTKEFHGVYFENEDGILGYVIYKMAENNRCFIHLVDALHNSDFVIILQAFCDYIFKLKQPSFLFAFEATNPKLIAAFRKNGFIYNPLNKGPFSYRPPLILHSNQEKIQGINFFDAQNWDIQGITRDY